jgi:hypothetical protein
VFHCAPLLYGLKISNILKLNHSEVPELMKMLRGTGIKVNTLYDNGYQSSFLLLYDSSGVERYLSIQTVENFMKDCGYMTLQIDYVLSIVSQRYQKYMEGSSDFPHELGIILGYPIEDVIGFINNRGLNSLYAGYWKVYNNVLIARQTFSQYDMAKIEAMEQVKEGLTIREIYSKQHM